MSRTFNPIVGGGAGGAYQVNDPFGFQTAEKLRNDLALLALGCFQRNVFAGGSQDFWLDASASGDFDLPSWLPIEADNSNSQISGSSSVIVQFRYFLRVSNAGITATPKVYDITAGAAATISGAVACSTTLEDFSGANQQQTVTLTLPAAKHQFKPRVTIGGSPATGYRVWGLAMYDCYING